MRITYIGPPKQTSAWDITIEFDDEFDSGIDMDSMCCWVSNTFKENFIILEYSEKSIAGGCLDNAKAWNDGYDSDRCILIYRWELRCSSEDSSMFLLKYSHYKETA